MKKKQVLLVPSLVLLFLACSPNSTQPSAHSGQLKDLSFAIAMPCKSKEFPEIKSAYVYISADDFDTITSELSVSPCTVSGMIANIPVGKNRQIDLRIYDKNNQLCYFGESEIAIEPGITTEVFIRLKSQTGSVVVYGVIDEPIVDTSVNKVHSLIGCWGITQSNNEWGTIEFTAQIGDSIIGYSHFDTHSDGPILGKITGDSVHFRITYPGANDYGDYYGKFGTDTETITGFGIGSSGMTATWEIKKLDCNDTVKFLDGNWVIIQSNNQWGTLHFDQHGSIIYGYSSFETHSNGPISGKVTRDSVYFRITYGLNDYGDYYGKLSADGKSVDGWGLGGDGQTATWKIIKDEYKDSLGLSGCWEIKQSNNHFGELRLAQMGNNLYGYSRFTTQKNGSVSGSIVEDSVYFRITYSTGYGDYYGKLSQQTISGSGRGNDGQTANWSAERIACKGISYLD